MKTAADAQARPCPYCRSALGERERLTECPACRATYHGDCWDENGGCAVPLCEAGPKANESPTEAEAPTEAVPVRPPPPPPPAPRPPLPTVTSARQQPPVAVKPGPPPGADAGRSGGVGWLPVVIGLIILLGGGSAAAVILTRHKSSDTVPASDQTANASAAASGDESSEDLGSETPAEPETEPVYNPSPPERVEQALQAHFGRLVADNYAAAYADLTPAEGEAIGGEESWVAAAREDRLKHFELSVDVSMHGPHAATAEITYFATHAYASGCHTWTGSWEMVKQYGQWLIAAADLERGSC